MLRLLKFKVAAGKKFNRCYKFHTTHGSRDVYGTIVPHHSFTFLQEFDEDLQARVFLAQEFSHPTATKQTFRIKER